MKLSYIYTLLLIVFLNSFALVKAQNAVLCEDVAYQEFDFWLGTWDVYANGQLIGANRVTKILDGCAIEDNWKSIGDFSGKGINTYDATKGIWKQVWIDNLGQIIYFTGKYDNGNMTMNGQVHDENLNELKYYRITLINNNNGTVRQVWEVHTKEQQEWEVVLDAMCVQRKKNDKPINTSKARPMPNYVVY